MMKSRERMGWNVPVVSHWGISGGRFPELAGPTAGGKIAAIQPSLPQARETIDVGGRLVNLDLIESHIHLDKSAILNRCQAERGDLEGGLVKKMVPRSLTMMVSSDIAGTYAPPAVHDPVATAICGMAMAVASRTTAKATWSAAAFFRKASDFADALEVRTVISRSLRE
jgi:hypothetical protein